MIDYATDFYIARSDVSTRMLEGRGAVLFHPDTGREKIINSTGAFIWARLDGSRLPAEIVEEILDNFNDVPHDQVSDDLSVFLNSMTDEGFVSIAQARAATGGTARIFPDSGDGPKSLDLSLTGRCNLHCDYCFYSQEMKLLQDLPLDEWLRFFKELRDLAVQDVCLSGGEVFVRPDLWELIDALIDNRLRYSILTNGTLVTEDTLVQFEAGKRRQRLSSIQVSIDGSCAEVHDKSRGRGSFEKAIRGLRLLMDAGFPVTARVTVNRHNVDDLDNIAGLLLDDIKIASFGTNDAMPIGSGCDNQKTITLTPKQQVKAMKTLAGLADKYDGRITATAGPLAKWRSFQEMEHARATGKMSTRWQMGYLTACGCMYGKLSVHHNGIITPCNILAEMELGRINRDELTVIWKTHSLLQSLKDRRQIPMTEVPGCEDCEWAHFCNGSCPGLAYELTGDVNRANPHDCYYRFLQNTGGMNFELD
ncbi:SynChlorMet cassette radical SAM/SPASM protein ScmE [Candidatus Fermentibacteria bacterium]|nr:MAG: SynChlorMet cassette radical SAM/SPASM protein ScmE [Candidatus Fermentibacteria bacterium]